MKFYTIFLIAFFLGMTQAMRENGEIAAREETEEADDFDTQVIKDMDKTGLADNKNNEEISYSNEEETESLIKSGYRPTCSVGSVRVRPINTIGGRKKTISGLSHPKQIHITDDGKVFVTEYGRNFVHIYNQAGVHIKKFTIPHGSPTGVFVKGNTVLVTNHKKEVFMFTTDGELTGVRYGNEPVGVALDYDDLMYVSEWRTGRIQVYHRDGSKSHVISGIGSYPRKIQFDRNGVLYVPAFYKCTIFTFNKCGKPLRQYYVHGVQHMEGLFVDSAGFIYVGERNRNNGKVYILNKSTGKVVKVISGFVGVSDISIAPDGTMWVVDFLGNKIYHY